jgi:allophanate hydrolase subunit 2
MTLRVLAPGLHSLVVDWGRRGSRSLGVPVGGAADRWSLALGNGLVGNAPDAAALEISLAGPTLRAECMLGCVIFGAPFELHSDRQRLTAGTTFTLHAGEELHIGGVSEEMRAYLCVRGGLQEPIVFGSRSTLAPIAPDTQLHCLPGSVPRCFIRPQPVWNREPKRLRIMQGPQAGWFRLDDFLSQEFAIAPASNRMGLRLRGRPMQLPQRELLSEPVCPGTVQVTRDGQCIILGVDAQTIGGYPKIAQVISADLDKLGQLRPGDHIRFLPINLDEAERLYRQKQAELAEWVTRLAAAGERPSVSPT